MLHLRGRAAAGPLPARARRHRRLRLAVPEGGAEHPRLRRRRPEPSIPRSAPTKTSTSCRRRCARAAWAAHGHGAEPHVHRLVGERWWHDVLENGRSSPYARFFDIDWQPPKAELDDKVLLPVLGDQYGRVLEDEQICRSSYDGRRLLLPLLRRRGLPIGPRTDPPASSSRSSPTCAGAEPDDAPTAGAGEHPDRARAPAAAQRDRRGADPRAPAREGDRQAAHRRAGLVERRRRATALERELRDAATAARASPRSFDALEALLASRPTAWLTGASPPRRSTTAASSTSTSWRRSAWRSRRCCEPVHAKAFELLRAGKVTGLRIDHVDGLLDPARLPRPSCAPGTSECRRRSTVRRGREDPVGDEQLPADWPVARHDRLRVPERVNGLFVDADGARADPRDLPPLHRRARGTSSDLVYRDEEADPRRLAVQRALHAGAPAGSHLGAAPLVARLHAQQPARALGEVIACFPVYRTYVSRGDASTSAPRDRRHILRAMPRRQAAQPAMSARSSTSSPTSGCCAIPTGSPTPTASSARELVLRLQQLTGPVMAKGMEDTAFYRYYPLVSLNEVGGEPARSGSRRRRAFHR